MKKTIFVAFVLTSSVSFAQKFSNKISFAKGQKVEVVTNITISAESMMGPTSGTITTADVYTVNDAGSSTFTLAKVPKQVKLNFKFGSQEIKMDSDNPKDLEGPFAQPVKELLSQKPEFTIDAAGKVVAVKKEETKKPAGAGDGGMMGMMLPGMDFASPAPQVGNPSFFQVLPAREVGVGDTWTDSLNEEGNKNVAVYKVKDVTDKEVVVDFTGEGTTNTKKSAMGMDVNVNAASRSEGSIVIDKATGLVKQKTTTVTSETKMNLGGQEMTSTIKTTMVTNVNPL